MCACDYMRLTVRVNVSAAVYSCASVNVSLSVAVSVAVAVTHSSALLCLVTETFQSFSLAGIILLCCWSCSPCSECRFSVVQSLWRAAASWADRVTLTSN
uniref:Uncharacterized protein n=1 Tax=Anguilla anguilla TaxID=7936 RepID=A0A0E9W4R4_ANGAN